MGDLVGGGLVMLGVVRKGLEWSVILMWLLLSQSKWLTALWVKKVQGVKGKHLIKMFHSCVAYGFFGIDLQAWL